ncbi:MULTISPECIES: hypothetical protein [Yersinia]|uniref:Uncharacterized protein n=2 Tax=Yersinia TaxID=629 RepID=A0A0T9RGD0_9GAMM|nr:MULTISPECIES: hypothetical protein [Yersinia]MBO1551399.1 hypothetical protein [Yersinia pseudotuberculosis]MBO1562475.1 hypothetical protein [Yersinia pseudotuberculosis]MBO1571452.1 hypothetical protein [Yersinia pseudotuberculosis]MBO1586404.1 hypothetical protein [Yersinia pseudotuberculosis]MBO1631767.1 hypothetical protein [Yersinia pseudotuberculosis]
MRHDQSSPVFYITGTTYIYDYAEMEGDVYVTRWNRKTLETVREVDPTCHIIPFKDAFMQINEAARTQPERITLEEYERGWSMLPTMRKMAVSHSSSFMVNSRFVGYIVPIYVRIFDVCFMFLDSEYFEHEEILEKIKLFVQTN